MGRRRQDGKVNERATFWDWLSSSNRRLFGLTAFEDPDGLLTLSPKQKSHLSSWRRPHEVSKNPTIMDNVSSYSIVQDIVSDCSFVSSLCIVAMFEKKFNQPLLSNCIYPQDSKGRPLYNESGKYMVKVRQQTEEMTDVFFATVA